MLLPEIAEIHDQYLSLSRIARERFEDSLAGKLLFCSGFGTDSIAALVAASVAGAATLCAEANRDRLREGLRAGLCDFVVGYLDEALRILKNELRRGLPVSVGVTLEPLACMAQMIERGLQPDLLMNGKSDAEDSMQVFVERGAVTLQKSDAPGTSLLLWSVTSEPIRTMPQIARLAAEALEPSRTDTPARQRWLASAPRYLGRAFGSRQCLRMSDAEIAAFVPRLHRDVPSASLTG